ncbi:MAG: hypothetical protein M1839_006484 [Geoglossum umbratile]|nr:MAG: hypothetical protein M1839_006484 [Geoglossum umbratile]
MSLAPVDAGSDTNLEVAFALCDLEIAKGREVLAGSKQDVDFDRLESSRAIRDQRDACYVEAWNVELSSVDFSGRPLEDDLGHGQSHRANMVAGLIRDGYEGRPRDTRGEPSRRGGRLQTHFHGPIGRRQEWGSDRRSTTDAWSYNASYDRAAAGPATTSRGALGGVAAKHPWGSWGSTTKMQRVKPGAGGSSEGSTFEKVPGGTTKIEGVGANRAESRGVHANAPLQHLQPSTPQPLHQPVPKRGLPPSGPNFDKMLERATKIQGMGAYGAASRSVHGDDPLGPPTKRRDSVPDSGKPAKSRPALEPDRLTPPITPVRKATRVQQPVYHLTSPKDFMENAHKVWKSPSSPENTDGTMVQVLDSAIETPAVDSSRDGAGKATSQQVVESTLRPVEEELVPLSAGSSKGAGHNDGDYAALRSLYPHVNSDIILLNLNECDGKVEDAKASLEKRDLSLPQETADKLDLIDLFSVDPKTKTSAIVPAPNSRSDPTDLIDFGADPLPWKSYHLLDDELSSNLSTLSINPALVSRSGNIPDSSSSIKVTLIDDEPSTHSQKTSTPHVSVPLDTVSQGFKASDASKALPTPVQTQSQKASAPHVSTPPNTVSQGFKILGASKALPTPIQPQNQSAPTTSLAGSIWADGGERNSGPNYYQRRRG